MSGVEWLMVQHDQTKEKYNDIFSQASYYLPQFCDGLNEVKNLDHEDWKTDADLKDVADSLPDLGRSAEYKDSARPEYGFMRPKSWPASCSGCSRRLLGSPMHKEWGKR